MRVRLRRKNDLVRHAFSAMLSTDFLTISDWGPNTFKILVLINAEINMVKSAPSNVVLNMNLQVVGQNWLSTTRSTIGLISLTPSSSQSRSNIPEAITIFLYYGNATVTLKFPHSSKSPSCP